MGTRQVSRYRYDVDRHPHTTGGGGGGKLTLSPGLRYTYIISSTAQTSPKNSTQRHFLLGMARSDYLFFFLLVTSSVHKCVKTVKIFCLKLVCHYPRCIYIRSIHVLAIDGVYKLQYTQTHLFSLRSMHHDCLSIPSVINEGSRFPLCNSFVNGDSKLSHERIHIFFAVKHDEMIFFKYFPLSSL